MKASTKYQINLVSLIHKKLKPITKTQEKYFIDKSFFFYGVKHYKNIICLECKHTFNGSFNEKEETNCPSCKKTIKDVEYHSSGYASRDGHGVIFDKIDDIAVIRVFYLKKHMKKNELPSYTVQEVVQKFFDPTHNKFTLFQRTINGMMGNYGGGWAIGSELALRGHDIRDNYRTETDSSCLIYPNKRIPEHFKKAGFHFYSDEHVKTYDKLMYIFLDSRLETLYKYNEKQLLRHFLDRQKMTPKHWSALKIVFRNQYFQKNEGVSISDWLDLVNLLIEFKKDTSSPHYVCPSDFHAMHNKFNKLKTKKREAERRRIEALNVEQRKLALIKKAEEAIKDQERYQKLKEKYFGIVFQEKELKIEVFKSVQQFMEEGDLLHHCVFNNGYYKREDSLVLSARYKDKIVETVEVSLSTMEIVQSRGYDNHPTKHHNKILKLVSKNLPTIQSIYQNLQKAV